MASVMDLMVRVFGDGSDFRRDVEQDKEAIDEFVNDVDSKRPVIDVSTEGIPQTEAELDAVDAKVDALDGKVVEVDIREHTYRDTNGRLRDTDTGQFVGGGNGNDAGGNGRGSGGAGRRGGRVGPLLGGAIAAGAGISPAVLGPALAGAMGLVSAFASAGVATAGFGAVATSVLGGVFQAESKLTQAQQAYNAATTAKGRQAALKKEQAALSGLDANQQKALKSLQNFKSFWDSFTHSLSGGVFKVFANGLKLLQTLLTDMKPAISGAAQAFGTLMQDAEQALKSPFWKQFFSFIGKTAKPMIEDFGKIFGNLLKVFAGVTEAFAPMAKSMMGGLVHLTKELANWASSLKNSKGFKEFIDYVKQNGPKVLKTIGNLFNIAKNLMIILAPIGSLLLTALEKVSKWVADVTKKFIQWEKHMKGTKTFKEFVDYVKKYGPMLFKTIENIVKVIINIAKALAPLAKLAIEIFMPIIKVIIQVLYWISKLLVWFTSTTKTSKQITADLKKIWGDIEKFFEKWVKTLGKWFSNLWSNTKKLFKNGSRDSIKWVEKMYHEIIHWFEKLPGRVWKAVKQLWNNIKSSFHNGVNNAENAVRHLIHTISSFFSHLPGDALKWGENMMHGFVQGIENMFGAVGSAAHGAIKWAKKFLGFHSPAEEGEGRHIVEWGANMIHGFIDGINSAVPQLQTTLAGVLQEPQFALNSRTMDMLRGNSNAWGEMRNGLTAGSGQSIVLKFDQPLVRIEHFHGQNEQDLNQLAKRVYEQQQELIRGLG